MVNKCTVGDVSNYTEHGQYHAPTKMVLAINNKHLKLLSLFQLLSSGNFFSPSAGVECFVKVL